MSGEDTRSYARRQAAATRRAAGPSIKLLSRPGSPYLAAVPPDDRFGPAGVVRPLWGYDANHPPPELPAGASGAAMQRLTVDELCDMVDEHHCELKVKPRRQIVRGARALLQRLMRYPGETWEQRWLTSGCDAAPRTWMDHGDLPRFGSWSPTLRGMNALIELRVLRPSYSWILDSHQKVNLPRLLGSNGGDSAHRLRQLPAYQAAITKQRVDAEAALARVMIRTGKVIEQITGDDLLYYADVVKTSGRQRREHLLWELLVQLGPLAGETPTLRATWSANPESTDGLTSVWLGYR